MDYKILKKKVFILSFFGVILATFLFHSTYINNEFKWLDHRDIEDRRAIVPLSSIHTAFLSRYGDTGFYRPVVTLINSIDYFIYRNSSWGFHLTNVLLHLIATAIVPFFILKYFDFNIRELLISALIFGIHPVSSLPVGVISYRPELLAIIFTMLALIYHVKSRTSNKISHAIIVIVFLLLALFSKETSLFWIISLIFFWEFINFPANSNKKIAYLVFIFEAIAIIFYIILRMNSVNEIWRTPQIPMSLSEYIGTRLIAFAFQIMILINPFGPKFSDAAFILPMTNFKAFIILLMLLLIISVIILKGIKNNLSKSLIIIFIALAPSLNIIPLPRFKSVHYSYFAVVGLTALIITAIKLSNALSLNLKYASIAKKSFYVIIILWIIIMSLSTFKSGFQFESDLTLFQKQASLDNNFLEAHYYLGNYYFKKREYNLAEMEYELAIPKNDKIIAFVDKTSLLTNLAIVFANQGKNQEAGELLLSIEQDAPDSEKPLIAYNRAVIAFNQGNYTKAYNVLNKYKDKYQRAEPLLLLVYSLEKINKTDEAKLVFEKMLKFINESMREELSRAINTK